MSDKDILLASLEAQGREFLTFFSGLETNREGVIDDQNRNTNSESTRSTAVNDELEEWSGFASDDDLDMDMTTSAKTRSDTGSKACTPDVVVFRERTATSRTHSTTKSQVRSFMSSKVFKLKESSTEASHNRRGIEDVDNDISNAQNDSLLHRLVHTQLLSGSLNPELNLTAAQRRKALAGRVLELTGDSKLGNGESNVRQDERQKASKRVRDGIMAKQKERNVKLLTEAKDVGNYHPTLKRLFPTSSGTQPLKRARGLKMGVGKFSGGMLKLTPEEIGSVQNVRSTRDRRSSGKRRR